MSDWPETDIETRIGIAPLEMLQAERLILVERVATLAAQFGSFGTWDATRKATLAGIKAKLRAEAHRDKVKKTDGQLDDEAHAHSDYTDFITHATQQRAEWIKADRKINDLTERVNRGQMLGRYASMEPRT
jgi:hypothetical protein